MSEVKRYQAVHIRYEENNIRYGEGCEVDMVTASDFDKQAQEIERLRSIISDCAKSCGATVSVECSLDFMAHLPVEIAVVISTLREERDSQQRTCIAAMTELSQLKSRQSGVALPPSPYMPGAEHEEMTGYERGEAQGRCDMWEEVRRLNSSEPLPYWEPCNPGCDPEFNGQRSKGCAQICQPARAALSSPNPAEQLNKAQGDHSEHDLGMVQVEAQGEAVDVVAWLSETFANGRTCQRAGLSKTRLQGLRHGTEDKDARIISDQPLMTVAQHQRIVAALTAPPSIPETSVVVERELIKHCITELEDWAMSFPDAESMKTYEVSAALRAILSSKGGDQNG